MLREIWKIFKLNLRLAKEEITAMSAMMAGACISLFMIGCFPPGVILGFIFAAAGFLTLAKAVFRILVESEYGEAQILIKTLPFEEKSRKIGRLLGAGSAVFLNFAEVVLTLWGGYIGLHGYRRSASAGFLKWLYGWGGLKVSEGQIWAALPVKILFLLLLSLCTAAMYEYTVTRTHRKSRGRLSESYASYFSPLWVPALILCIFGRLLPLYVAKETFSFFFPAVQAAITGAALAGVMALMKREERESEQRTFPCKAADGKTFCIYEEGGGKDTKGKPSSTYRAYTELIGIGTSANWKMAVCLLPIAIAFRYAENLGLAVMVIMLFTVAALTELAQTRNTAVLFDENATFYYSLPLRTEEVVKAHMKIGYKMVFPVTLLLWGGILITVLFPEEKKTAAEVMGQLIGQTEGGIELWLLCGIWVLILSVMSLAFSGWALFNSAFASRWRDPVTHKSGGLAGGLTLILEVAFHGIFFALVLPFDDIDPFIGSLMILLLLTAECYGVYRLNVAELRDRYSL